MTTEELLKPRWKVIDDYPNSPFFIGQVFTIPNFDNQFTKDYWAADKNKYPNIFEPLPWWKERKVEGMPRFVKSIGSGQVRKVYRHWTVIMLCGQYEGPNEALGVCSFEEDQADGYMKEYWRYDTSIPATLDDYNAYLQATNQNDNP